MHPFLPSKCVCVRALRMFRYFCSFCLMTQKMAWEEYKKKCPRIEAAHFPAFPIYSCPGSTKGGRPGTVKGMGHFYLLLPLLAAASVVGVNPTLSPWVGRLELLERLWALHTLSIFPFLLPNAFLCLEDYPPRHLGGDSSQDNVCEVILPEVRMREEGGRR